MEIVQEGIIRLSMLLGIFLRKIDKIGAVREDVASRVVCMLAAEIAELVSVFILQGRVLPFPLRLEEHSEGVTAKINKHCVQSTLGSVDGHPM